METEETAKFVCITEEVDAVESVAGIGDDSALFEPTSKKRNRRRERGRKKPKDLSEDQSTSISAQIESLSLDSRQASDSKLEKSLSGLTLVSDNSHKEIHNAADVPSPTKKRIRNRKRNVALASIQKLCEANCVSNGLSLPQGTPKEVEIMSPIQPVNPGKGKLRQKVKPASAPHNNTNADPGKITHGFNNSKRSSKGGKADQSYTFHFNSKPVTRSQTDRNTELMLNENQFEEYLQRELVEVMMKEQSSVVKGFLRINPRNYREAYISNPDGSRDILIDGMKDRNRALEGDEIVVHVMPQHFWREQEGIVQKVGKVIHILTQVHHRQAVGSLKMMADGNSRTALFSPRDSRVPRMRIPLKECPRNTKDWENSLFHARIIEWTDVRCAKGQLIGDSFGVQGDIEAETRAILLENEINVSPYDEKLYVFFPDSPYTLTKEDLFQREDLRQLCIFTIDPATARDLDDAVSCEHLENGNMKVGVHISDVSHFLKEGTPLDKQVSMRATTTYLVQRAYHMLPREMTMLCSLLPGEDKLAFSVFWEITPEAEVISHYFTRSVIQSCTQLSYEHAQIMIDEPNRDWKEGELPKIYGGWTVADLKKVVLSLQALASIMRKHRFDSGALRVDQTKLMFHLDSAGEPVSFSAYINKESHRLIEEFMLLANITVATALQKQFPKLAFLRCHEEPHPDMLKKLVDVLEKYGIVLDPSTAGSLHASLQRYLSSSSEARFMALNSLLSRPMVRARYFCAATIGDVQYMRHYALNVPLYTHFTSPIRRYADVMVHRLLSALLRYNEEPKWTIDYVNSVAANCNKMKFCAKKAGEQSSELFMALWVRKHGTIEEEAVVIDVKDHSFDALICSTGSNVRVYTDKLAASAEFNNTFAPELKIVWSVAGGQSQQVTQVVSMFSVVKVALRTSNTNLLKLEANLLPPE